MMSPRKAPTRRKPEGGKMKLTTRPKISIPGLMRLFLIDNTNNNNKVKKKKTSRYSMNNNNNGATNARANLSECREELSRVKQERMAARLNLQRLENNKSSNNNSSNGSYNKRKSGSKSYSKPKTYSSLKSYGSMYS